MKYIEGRDRPKFSCFLIIIYERVCGYIGICLYVCMDVCMYFYLYIYICTM